MTNPTLKQRLGALHPCFGIDALRVVAMAHPVRALRYAALIPVLPFLLVQLVLSIFAVGIPDTFGGLADELEELHDGYWVQYRERIVATFEKQYGIKR